MIAGDAITSGFAVQKTIANWPVLAMNRPTKVRIRQFLILTKQLKSKEVYMNVLHDCLECSCLRFEWCLRPWIIPYETGDMRIKSDSALATIMIRLAKVKIKIVDRIGWWELSHLIGSQLPLDYDLHGNLRLTLTPTMVIGCARGGRSLTHGPDHQWIGG
jgi:hypothetical protein